jgi:hypothetical protein
MMIKIFPDLGLDPPIFVVLNAELIVTFIGCVLPVTGIFSTRSGGVCGDDVTVSDGIMDCEPELFAIVAGVVEFCTHPEKKDSNSKREISLKKNCIPDVFLCFIG